MTGRLTIFTEHVSRAAKAGAPAAPPGTTLTLTLPFEQRQKARQRGRLAAGFDIGIQLPRGTVLRGGDWLRAGDGTTVEIVAAREPVSTVWCRDLRRLAQVAYHLGNRHVALEIGTGWVRYLADHVLDAMVLQLGLAVVHHDEPFEPENGAYSAHGHAHDAPRGAHAHDHSHTHDHDARHGHAIIFGTARQHAHDHER